MKVLDPQSALLTNAEVYQFMKSRPTRKPDDVRGAYPVTNLTGHKTVLKDFETYTTEITPHIISTPPLGTFIKDLVRRLKPYELTKTEVVNLVNMGLGVRVAGSNQAQQNGEEENGESNEDEEGEAAMARDIQFFRVVVEESDERFEGEEGEERIREVVGIMRDCMGLKGEGK